jgi:hypothetical protein
VASEEERKSLGMDPSEQVEINLFDGSTVRVDPYHYIEVSEPTDFIFGVGEQLDRSTGKYKPFRGKIFAPYVDSVDTISLLNSPNKIIRHSIRLPDSSVIRFEREDFLALRSDQGVGLWCAGHITAIVGWGAGALVEPTGDAVNGRIPYDEIKSIEPRKFSIVKTALCGIGVSAFVASLVVLRHNYPEGISYGR